MTHRPRTTVAIPLHASAPWLSVVEANLRRLAGRAQIVVSDGSGLDDTLDQLRERCTDLPGIVWRSATTPGGWVGHCNVLLDEATTEYFMWLPHDDDIDDRWVPEAERVLDHDDSVVLALGDTLGSMADGQIVALNLDARLSDPDVNERLAAVADIWVNGETSSLGVSFRGVFRRAGAPALPQLDAVGSWSDLLWAGNFLSQGRFATTTARYLKRYHSANTHGVWARMRDGDQMRTALLPQLLGHLDPAEAARIVGATWNCERRRLSDECAALRREVRAAEMAAQDQETMFRTSTSWRMTAPLRRLGALLRRLRRRRAHDRSVV